MVTNQLLKYSEIEKQLRKTFEDYRGRARTPEQRKHARLLGTFLDAANKAINSQLTVIQLLEDNREQQCKELTERTRQYEAQRDLADAYRKKLQIEGFDTSHLSYTVKNDF